MLATSTITDDGGAQPKRAIRENGDKITSCSEDRDVSVFRRYNSSAGY